MRVDVQQLQVLVVVDAGRRLEVLEALQLARFGYGAHVELKRETSTTTDIISGFESGASVKGGTYLIVGLAGQLSHEHDSFLVVGDVRHFAVGVGAGQGLKVLKF